MGATPSSHSSLESRRGRTRAAAGALLALVLAIGGLVSSPLVARAQTVPGPEEIGQWGPVGAWPVVAVHASLLPDGTVLFWQKANGGLFEPGFQETTAHIWDPASDTVQALSEIAHNDLFCSGHASLSDGRTIVVGGHNVFIDGHAGVNIYDPVAQTWTQAQKMSQRRWYPTAAALPDGRLLVAGGHIDPGIGPDKSLIPALVPEIYDPLHDAWKRLDHAVLPLHSYPFLFVLPDGKILQAKTTTTRTLDLSTGLWTEVATTPNANPQGSAAMYRLGRILKSGGGQIATAAAEVIDMSAPSPAWRSIAPMLHPRHDHNLVLLPDGEVLAVGGSVAANNQTNAVLPAELWDPQTETWTEMAAMDADPRMYHSTVLLLPDGRVLAAGGDNYPSRQVYEPPYLFRGPRPTATAVSDTVRYQTQFDVETPDGASIASVSLIRPGSVTHAFDQNQRYVPLSFYTTTEGIGVLTPDSANEAPPGVYMLFLVNQQGVPSIAKFVTLKGACRDGIDDDHDGLIDHPQDPGCANANDDSELDPAVACDDGIDNDGDGVIDFGPIPGTHDPGCTSAVDTSELPVNYACSDGLDNDGDGVSDYPDDPGCASAADASERAQPPCSDGLDNDGDGLVDYPDDPECSALTWGSESTPSACSDGIDNDGDGFIDFGFAAFDPTVDPECTSASDGSELALAECEDGVDNDGDGRIDWDRSNISADRECSSASDAFEGLVCDDGLDSDGDGLIDYPQDPGCADLAGAASVENPQCEDHFDNDSDGLIDYPLDPGCGSASGNVENPQCSDGIDNDGDGAVDLADADCSSSSDASEAVVVQLIGNSITQGAVSGGGGTPYAEVVASELGSDFDVRNLGCGGSTSLDWRPDAGVIICAGGFIDLWKERVVPSGPAEAATVLLGTNDSTGFFEPQPVAGADYIAAIEAIVDGLQSGGVTELTLMTPPARCPGTEQAVVDRLVDYRLRIFTMCQTKPGVVCGPDVFKLLDPLVDYDACNVHPNAQGHAKLGMALAASVEDLHACTEASTPGFDACAPAVDPLAEGAPVGSGITVTGGTQVRFDINATDPNGIGFPVFAWLGSDSPVKVIWDFDGAPAAGTLAVFNPTPLVTFELASGGASQTYHLSGTVYDGSGKSTTFAFDVLAVP